MAKALGLSVADVLTYCNGENPLPTPDSIDPKAFYRFATGFDADLMYFLRDRTRERSAKLSAGYRRLVEARLQEAKIPLRLFVEQLAWIAAGAGFSSQSAADLTVEVDRKLESIRFVLPSGATVLQSRPRLLWDCHCGTPLLPSDSTTPGHPRTFRCPIHASPHGKSVVDAFLNHLVEIRWQDLRIAWKRLPELWPPSTDTFHMANALDLDGIYRAPVESVLDLGCGTGALGILVAARNPSVVRLDLADWLLTPLLCAMYNWSVNRPARRKVDVRPRLGMYTNWLGTHEDATCRYGVVVCNPPYLPYHDSFPDLATRTAVAGTDLLERVITDGAKLGQRVYVSFSSVAMSEAQRAADCAGMRLDRVGEEVTVPFRVRTAFENLDYLQWLVAERGLKYDRLARHPYTHRIATFRVVPRR